MVLGFFSDRSAVKQASSEHTYLTDTSNNDAVLKLSSPCAMPYQVGCATLEPSAQIQHIIPLSCIRTTNNNKKPFIYRIYCTPLSFCMC